MPVLKGSKLDSYIINMVNQEGWNSVQDGEKKASQVKVRSNNANSKWLHITATSGRNPVWYKAMGLITFLDYTKKEGIVFFRVLSSQFAGGYTSTQSGNLSGITGQSKSVAFQASPGSWYLEEKSKYFTTTIGEFFQSCKELFNSGLIPEEILEVAAQFRALEEQSENVLTFARQTWKDAYNQLKKGEKVIKELGGDDGKYNMALKGIDNKVKEQLNRSKTLKNIQKPIKKISKGDAEFITNVVYGNVKPYTKQLQKVTDLFDVEGQLSKAKDKAIDSIFNKGQKSLTNGVVKKATKITGKDAAELLLLL